MVQRGILSAALCLVALAALTESVSVFRGNQAYTGKTKFPHLQKTRNLEIIPEIWDRPRRKSFLLH